MTRLHPRALLFASACLTGLASLAQNSQSPSPLPSYFPLADGTEVKTSTQEFWSFDQETFDIRNHVNQSLLKVRVRGRTWRFAVRSTGTRPVGALTLLARFKPALEEAGWLWEWMERGIAKRVTPDSESWMRITAGGSGELKVVLVEKGEPRELSLPLPGPTPELPSRKEDFPYLPPWPGAQLVASAVSQAPVGLKLPDGKETLAMVNFIDKEYSLKDVPAVAEFLASYTAALQKAGWEIEGTMRGAAPQLQATYGRNGRDIRVTLRLSGDAMGVSVADVGAQVPPSPKEKH